MHRVGFTSLAVALLALVGALLAQAVVPGVGMVAVALLGVVLALSVLWPLT